MSAHTNGPLKFLEQGEACEYCLVTDDSRWVISFRLNGEFMPLAQQDIARRIVACMNACEGIPTSLLELSTEGPATAAHYWQQVTKQRDELLAALKRASESLGRFTSDEGWAQSDMDCMDNADAIIAKVEAANA